MHEGSLAVDPEKSLFKFAAKEDSWGETVPNACSSRLVCLKAKIIVAGAGGSLHESMNFENREIETLREIGMPSFLPSSNTGPMTSGPFTPVSERLSSASLPRHRALGWALVTGYCPMRRV